MTNQIKVNKCRRYFSSSYKLVDGAVRINTHNLIEHELAKCIVAYKFIKLGKTVVTEAVFKGNKGRADIVILDDFKVIEILNTETEKEVLNKKSYYPKEFEIIYYKASDVYEGNIKI